MRRCWFCRSALSMSQTHTSSKCTHDGFQPHKCTCEQCMLHTRPQSELTRVSHTCSRSLPSRRHKEIFTASILYLQVHVCVLSFPAIIYITVTITTIYQNCSLLICWFLFCLHCSPGNKPVPLSLSFLPFFVQSSLLLLALLSAFR